MTSAFARWRFDPSGLTPHGFCLLWVSTAFMLALPTLPERELATIRQLAAKQPRAVRDHIEENWPKPVREALPGPDQR